MSWLADYWWLILLVLIGMIWNGIKALMRLVPVTLWDVTQQATHRRFHQVIIDGVPHRRRIQRHIGSCRAQARLHRLSLGERDSLILAAV